MKNVKIEIDINDNSLKNDDPITEYDINIKDFNEEAAYIEFEEEIDEKLISYIEREVRNSYEYRAYIKYLKDELDLTKCSLLPGIDTSNGAASLEFHHYPLNLYEISEIIAKKLVSSLDENSKVSCFDISELVMEEHYRGNIGLVPLTTTLHKMAHNKSIIVPISKVQGDYEKFIKRYSSYISEEIKDRVNDAKLNSESDDAKLYNQTKLEKNITNLNIKYNEDMEDSDE